MLKTTRCREGVAHHAGLLALAALLLTPAAALAQTNAANTATVSRIVEDIDWPRRLLEVYQDQQQQQAATSRALEQARAEVAAAKAAAQQQADETDARLRRMEQSLTADYERQMLAMQESYRNTLLLVVVVCAIGFLCILFLALYMLRMLLRRADYAPGQVSPLLSPYVAALGPGGGALAPLNPAEQSAARFADAVSRLEKRVEDMEHAAGASATGISGNGHDPLADAAAGDATPVAEPAAHGAGAAAEATRSHVALLLGKGQALLNMGQPEPALACFDEVLTFDGASAEAFCKRGIALQKLDRHHEALASYDRAIDLDAAMAVAYLYKGSVLNRLERYEEALKCYEQASRAQEQAHSAG